MPDLSVLLWGPMHTAERMAEAVVRHHGLGWRTSRLAALNPSVLEGLERTGQGVLYIQALTEDAPAYTSVARQLFFDRMVGAYEVPPGWCLWASASPNGRVLAAPLHNRFVHLWIDQEILDERKKGALTP